MNQVIREIVNQKFASGVEWLQQFKQELLIVDSQFILELFSLLKENENLYFDSLVSISSVDIGENFEIYYQIHSITQNLHLTIKTIIPKSLNRIESITPLYSAAEWHEREVYDLMGIEFENHMDMRRILLPNDWIGHPLLKNYQTQEYYHNIKVNY